MNIVIPCSLLQGYRISVILALVLALSRISPESFFSKGFPTSGNDIRTEARRTQQKDLSRTVKFSLQEAHLKPCILTIFLYYQIDIIRHTICYFESVIPHLMRNPAPYFSGFPLLRE
jgi:hypothetical protein